MSTIDAVFPLLSRLPDLDVLTYSILTVPPANYLIGVSFGKKMCFRVLHSFTIIQILSEI